VSILGPIVASSPTAPLSWRRILARSLLLLVFALYGALLAVRVVHAPTLWGDGAEYVYMVRSWYTHASPDLRPADIVRPLPFAQASAPPASIGEVIGYFPAKNGAYFSYHFWFYSLSAVPVYALIQAVGGDPGLVLSLTNLLWLIGAFVAIGLSRALSPRRRLAFAALAGLSPVLWYLTWTGPEVQTWSCVVIALCLLVQRRYPLAALFAAFGAWQNPPLLTLAAVIAVICCTTRDRRTIASTWLASASALLPSAFTLVYFGTPNLIASIGMADPRLASTARTLSLLTDFNQGLLPFVPLLLLLTLVAAALAVARHRWEATLVAAALVPIMLLCQSTTNWNAGCLGLIRYGVWLVPILAWLVATQIPRKRWALAGIGLAVLVQAAIVIVPGMSTAPDRESPVARAVLAHAPALYNPVPEIFIERSGLAEDPRSGAVSPERLGDALPITFVADDGSVTKILSDAAGLARLSERYQIDTTYASRLAAEYATTPGLFYVTPPTGTVRAR